jgi:hypothetical protein
MGPDRGKTVGKVNTMADRFPSRFAVSNLQLSLLALGYDCGSVDGVAGPKLAAALDVYRATIPGGKPAPKPEPKAEPWPADNEAALNAFYGTRGRGENMTVMKLPAPMRLYSHQGPEIVSLYVNKQIEKPLFAALKEVSELPAHVIAQHQLDVCGGVYNNRKKTGGNGWSVHAWGAAIDISPKLNGFGMEPDMPVEVVEIFKKHGAEWGGDWSDSNVDGMHFQWARS